MNDQIKINWYRCRIDRTIMSELMRTSDARGFLQVLPQLTLFLATWRQFLGILEREKTDPEYCFAPLLPRNAGGRVGVAALAREAASLLS